MQHTNRMDNGQVSLLGKINKKCKKDPGNKKN